MAQMVSTSFGLRPAEERYESEIAYFDREAEEAWRSLAPIDPRVVSRYRLRSRRRFNKEFRLSLLYPLSGKRVVEIGCGDGEQAVLLATLGADVTGIDISPKSVSLAEERAKLAGVAHRARFVCAPLTSAPLEEDQFDAVWGDGILHHVIPDLEEVMKRVVAWARPGARFILTEPVNLSPTLRKIRCMLPVPLEGTPDERPLEPREIDIISKYVTGMRTRPYLFMSRFLRRLSGGDASYEHSSVARRAVVNALMAADLGLLSVPPFGRLAGQLVMYGTIAK